MTNDRQWIAEGIQAILWIIETQERYVATNDPRANAERCLEIVADHVRAIRQHL